MADDDYGPGWWEGGCSTRYSLDIGQYPGVGLVPIEHKESADHGVNLSPYASARLVDVDQEIGGTTGETNNTPYTRGVVSPGEVENFDYTGRYIRIRRPPEGLYGPVAGGSDYSAGYLSALAQGEDHSVPDEYYYADLGGSI